MSKKNKFDLDFESTEKNFEENVEPIVKIVESLVSIFNDSKSIGGFTDSLLAIIGSADSLSTKLTSMISSIGGTIGAVVSLSSVIATYINEIETENSAHIEYIANQAQKTEIAKTQNEAWDSMIKKQNEKIQSDLAEMSYTSQLRTELEGLVDVNGKVRKGYEDRVNFILSQLNSAIGTEYTLVDGIIQEYGELTGSIDDVIAKKRAKAILDNQEASYTEAIGKRGKAIQEFSEVEADYLEKSAELKKAEAAAEYAIDDQSMENAKKRIDTAQKEFDAVKLTYDEKKKTVDDCTRTITEYEQNYSLFLKGDSESLKKINEDISSSETNKNNSMLVSMKDKAEAERVILQSLKDTYGNTEDEKVRIQTEGAQNRLDNALNEGLLLAEQQGIANEEELAIFGGFIQQKKDKAFELSEYLKNNQDEQAQAELNSIQNQIEEAISAYQEYLDSKNGLSENSKTTILQHLSDINDGDVTLTQEGKKAILEEIDQYVAQREEYAKLLEKNMASSNGVITQDMVDSAKDQAAKAKTEFSDVGIDMVVGLSQGVTGNLETSKQSGLQLTDTMLTSSSTKEEDFKKLGGNISNAVGIGSDENKTSLISKILGVFGDAIEAVKNFLGIHSPSRLFRNEIGKMIPQGIAKGIQDDGHLMKECLEDELEETVDAAHEYKNHVSDVFDDFSSVDIEMGLLKINQDELKALVKKAQKAVENEQIEMMKAISIENETRIIRDNKYFKDPILKLPDINSFPKQKTAQISINIDGREAANILAPYMDEELGFLR